MRRRKTLTRDALRAGEIGFAVSALALVTTILRTNTFTGSVLSIAVVAVLAPASGAAFGMVALRRRWRDASGFGPWMNALCCAAASIAGAMCVCLRVQALTKVLSLAR
jgi:hypothetical protein